MTDKSKMDRENKADDVKTLFDSIRNIGICVGLTLGLPMIQNTLGQGFWGATITYFSFGIILGLYLFNIFFTLVKLKEKPSVPLIYYIGFPMISILTTFIMGGVALTKVHDQMFNFNILKIFNDIIFNFKDLF